MGLQARAAFPVFAEAFDAVLAQFDPSLAEILRNDPDDLLNRTVHTQPALFALEVALFRLYASWGLRPDVLAGHSIGELAAAHCAGVLSLEDACTLVRARAELMESAPAGGAMAAVAATEEEVLPQLTGRVSVAAVNGPRSVVVAGDRGEVLAVVDAWRERGRKVKELRVSHAFHSPHMDGILDRFRAVAAGLTYREPSIPVVSNLTGRPAAGDDLRTPEYWTRHLREAVRFHQGVTALRELGVGTLLELGPDGTLCAMAHETLAGSAAVPVPSLLPGRPEPVTALRALAAAHAAGHPVRWPSTGAAVDLPTYPFQHRRYWLDPSPQVVAMRSGGVGRADGEWWDAVADADDERLAKLLALDTEQRQALAGVLPALARWHAATQAPDGSGPVPGGAEEEEEPPSVPLREQLAAIPEEERAAVLLDAVRRHTAAALGFDSPAQVDVGTGFFELGLSSFTAMEMNARLRAEGIELEPVAIYDHPTPAELAEHMLALLSDPAPVDGAPG
jgi:acyl transferase domain-containing protein